jgi:hypothetical protein
VGFDMRGPSVLSTATTESTDTQLDEPTLVALGPLRRRHPDVVLTRFLLEERSRRSFGLTGYLGSAAGGGAVACWFAINSLYASKAPVVVLRLLLVVECLFVCAAAAGFIAALAGYKAVATQRSLDFEGAGLPNDRMHRWLSVVPRARLANGMLLVLGAALAFVAYLQLCWG